MTGSRLVAARVFAVLAAFWMVVAFAVAALFPPELLLGQLVSMTDHEGLVAFQNFVRDDLSPWLWLYVCLPLLMRPAWFLPVAFGLLTAGVAVTLSSRPGAARSRRRS